MPFVMKFKLAVVQFEIKQFEPEINLKKAENFIQEAKKAGSKVIVFPEDFITGPIMKKKEFVDFDGKYRNHFQRLAKENAIDIVAGSWIEGDETGWYNTSYYIDKNGEIKGKYRKMNLWLPERGQMTPGKDIAVFDTDYGKVGLIICWDLFFPEMFSKMVKEGVEIIYCPSYWLYEDAGEGIRYDKKSEIKLVDSLAVGRAFENGIIFVYTNAAGKKIIDGKTDSHLIGHSQITAPFKGSIKRLEHNEEQMLIEEIDTKIIKDAWTSYKIREDVKSTKPINVY